MSIHDSCRFCKENLRVKGILQNTRKVFDANKAANEKNVSERLQDLGLKLCKDMARSIRICKSCFRLLGRIEDDFAVFRRWLEEEEETSAEATTSSEEKRLPCEPAGIVRFEKRDREPTPSKTPRSIERLCPPRRSLTERMAGSPRKILPAGPVVRHAASQTDPPERKSVSTQLSMKTSCRSTATQVKVPSKDCGVCTLTFPLGSPLLLLQPTIVKRPSKRPRLSLTDEEKGPSEYSLSMAVHEPESFT